MTDLLISADYLTARHPGLTIDAGQAEILITEVSGLIRGFCGWHLVPNVDETVTVDGTGATVQLLPTGHLTAVSDVTEDGTAVDPADFEWSVVGFLRRDTPWTTTLRGIVATISHGYDETPDDLKAVCASAVVRAITAPVGNITREQVGQVSVQYGNPADALSDVERHLLLRRYWIMSG